MNSHRLIPEAMAVCLALTCLTAPAEWKPSDAPNQPVGQGMGLFPGRVVWLHDPTVARWNGSAGSWRDNTNTDAALAETMVSRSVRLLAGAKTDAAAWDALFRHFNKTHGRGDAGYKAGEKIAVKLNLNSPECCNTPQVTVAIVRQLVRQAGVGEQDITLYDASRGVSDTLYNPIHNEFPKIRFEDIAGGKGREKARPDLTAALHFADTNVPDSGETYLPVCATRAAYMINLAVLKAHDVAGVTLCAKNHFGSVWRQRDTNSWNKGWSPGNLHDAITVGKRPMASYNPLVELMGHKDLGGKTVLYFIDALYAAPRQSAAPARWASAPFNGHWTASVFASQDPVAIESVAVDFFAAETVVAGDGSEAGKALRKNVTGSMDNYLHEAAQAAHPPSGVKYDPEGDGSILGSLGVHEHWNNPSKKQYSRNLDRDSGIELVTGAAKFVEVASPPSAEIARERARNEAAGVKDQCGNLWRLAPSGGGAGPVTVMVSGDPEGIHLRAPPAGRPLTPGGWTLLKADAWSFVWVAGEAGLYRFDPRRPESSWMEFPARDKIGGAVTAMGLSPDGAILAGTDGGALYEVDFTEKDLPVARRFDAAGLPARPVAGVHTDRDGAVWASCGGKTYKAEPAADAWQKNWEELAAMPFGSHDVFGAELGGKLYVPGGMASHGLPARFTYFPEMFTLDPDAGWTMTRPMSRPLCYSGVAVLDGKVWVVGGGENRETDRDKDQKRVPVALVHIYDPAKGTWEMGPSLPEPRMEPIVAAVNGRIYCCMGSLDANAAGRTTVLSIAAGEKNWCMEPACPLTGGQSSGCHLDGIIYIAASRVGLVAFDPAGGRWDTTLPSIPSDAAPSALLCAAHKGEVWVMGGYGTRTPRATWRYNPKTRRWAAGPDLPTPLCWGAAAEVNGQLIVAGGGCQSHGTYVFPNRAYRLREER